MSNYDKMLEQASVLFLSFSQEEMIEKLTLEFDEEFLFVNFFHKAYQIDRKSGKVFSREGNVASFNVSMSIYDMLCHSKEKPKLSGRWSTVENLNRIRGCGTRHMSLLAPYASAFDQKSAQLLKIAPSLGAVPGLKGDVSFLFPAFDFFPVVFQFWNSDEEFPAQLTFLWDDQALQFVHYETLWYMMMYLCDTLKDALKEWA